uniref:Uncharacterized protein n=1 Tax=Escherichia coli TaxID=562 RepID=A0A1X9WJH5_ECOLX|nr:hypothetical protein [Escherichia coli]
MFYVCCFLKLFLCGFLWITEGVFTPIPYCGHQKTVRAGQNEKRSSNMRNFMKCRQHEKPRRG